MKETVGLGQNETERGGAEEEVSKKKIRKKKITIPGETRQPSATLLLRFSVASAILNELYARKDIFSKKDLEILKKYKN